MIGVGRDRIQVVVAGAVCAGALLLAPATALAQRPGEGLLRTDPLAPVTDVVRGATGAAGGVVSQAAQTAGQVVNDATSALQTAGASPTAPLPPTEPVTNAVKDAVPVAAAKPVVDAVGGAAERPAARDDKAATAAPPASTPAGAKRSADPAPRASAPAAPQPRSGARTRQPSAQRRTAPRTTTRRARPAATRARNRSHPASARTRAAATPERTKPAAPSRKAEPAKPLAGVRNAVDRVVQNLPDWSRPIIAILLALVLILGLRAFVSSRQARRLERARIGLRADVDLLQSALVPALPERIGGVDLSVAYRPAAGLASGGDFYDVFALGEHRTGIILGDVSGHDREAIARASAVRHKLRAYLELGLEPRAVLHAAGDALASDSSDGEFATAVVAVHDSRENTLTYACAGHPPPILTGSAAHDPVLVCSSAPLGWGLPTGRRQTTIELAGGALACFFTDGLTEARVDGAFLEREGLNEIIGRLGDAAGAAEIIDAVVAAAGEATDDLAALVIRSAAAPQPTGAARIEEVELDAREAARQSPERFLAACDAPAALIESLGEATRAALADGGRTVLRVRIDAATHAVDAELTQVAPLAVAG